jgi:hypothetical protein
MVSFRFYNWKDAVHYLTYCSKYQLYPGADEAFDKWCRVYGYYDADKKFNGDHSEFMNDYEDEILVGLRVINKNTDLRTETLWKINPERRRGL